MPRSLIAAEDDVYSVSQTALKDNDYDFTEKAGPPEYQTCVGSFLGPLASRAFQTLLKVYFDY